MLSYHDTGGTEPEKVYQAFILGMLVRLHDEYEIKSNRESGYGRYDVMIIPKDTNKKGIVIELKTIDKFENEDYKKALDAALIQINDKNYEQELIDRGITNILKLAIVLDGKRVFVKNAK